MHRKIAFLTYETPFAPGGGISAVMKYLPVQFREICKSQILVITPFHHKIDRTATLMNKLDSLGKIQVSLDQKPITVEILTLEQDGTWVFLRPDNKRIFAGLQHPYDVGKDQKEIETNLLRDALLYGIASVAALQLIDPTAEWMLLLQDWEAATAVFALAGKEHNLPYRSFLTIHNTYDMPASNADLHRFGIQPAAYPGETVLQRALPFVEHPIFTVSDQFASDLLEDPLQTQVMASHLFKAFTSRLLGVDNGLFSNCEVDPVVMESAQRGQFSPLIQWKDEKRKKALQAFDEFSPTVEKPLWGNLQKFKRDNFPWFIMAGRDDPRQKGYDLACHAVSSYLNTNTQACFLFFPIPGGEGINGLRFLKDLAQIYPENVLVLPFIFQEGFIAALQGATYGIMPSFYEPFGMANEFYMNGTVGIGRATGGILQQIIPLRSASAFSEAVKSRAVNYYSVGSLPTGILFRERDGIPSSISNWKVIARSEYKTDGTGPNRIQQRSQLPLFSEMANELRISILDGIRIYYHEQYLYHKMLIEGVNYLQRTYSWNRAAQSYLRILNHKH